MNNTKSNLLTSNQFTFLLVGFTLGPGFLRLPNAITAYSKQDAWISSILGLLYPLYIIIIGSYIIRNHPKENLLTISRKHFGKFLGNTFNFLFLQQFIFFTASVFSDFSTVSRIYIVAFLTPTKVAILTFALILYSVFSGLKTLAKVGSIIGYMIIFMILFSVAALKYGNILNLQPVLGSSISDIFKGTRETLYFYALIEVLLLYHPLAENINFVKKSAIKALLICGTIWVWTVWVTTYYLGEDIISKSFYSFLLVFESIHLPIINNFRYVAMFIWTLVTFRVLSNYYYTTSFIINDIIKTDINKIHICIFPLMFYLSTNVILKIKKEYLPDISLYIIIFNIIFISSIAFIIAIKNKINQAS